jgi:hypothetical protein
MAANAIVDKLNTLLAGPIDSECKAVYLLCEIRKLLEREPAARRPFALNMCCHSALHVDLHGKDTTTPFLRQVDDYIHGLLIGPEDSRATSAMVREFLSLNAARSQLRDFCLARGIRTDLSDDRERWREFVRHYAGVIEDGSLAIRAPNHGLRHVKRVTFIRGPEASGELTLLPFDMGWRVELLDGRSIRIEVNASPETDGTLEMVGWAVHLNE